MAVVPKVALIIDQDVRGIATARSRQSERRGIGGTVVAKSFFHSLVRGVRVSVCGAGGGRVVRARIFAHSSRSLQQ